MTEQPKEYIISRDHAEEYAKLYAEANTADFAKMTEVRRVANDFLKQIRSRPISTTPEGAAPELMQTVYRCCEFYEAPTLDNPKSGCKMVQAAREKVLDECMEAFFNDPVGRNAVDDEVKLMDEILGRIESLRHNKEQP
jgi:hypothetical protein